MDKIKELSKTNYIRSEKKNTIISKKLDFEIKATQKMLSDIYKKRYKRKKLFNRIQASDFIADTYRNQRYKIKNE